MKKDAQGGNLCFLMDAQGRTLAQGALMEAPSGRYLQVRILEDIAGEPLHRREVQLVSMADGAESILARVTEERGSRIVLEKLQNLGHELRQNVRVPIVFSTPIYPLSGDWRGRRWVQSVDLSCGGIAFLIEEELAVGERLEVVIPITDQPLVLPFEVLRTRPHRNFCAGQFVDLCHDQEALVRKAVFGIQIDQRVPGSR
ncbi:MAG: PilZ domain-containing protein [Oscillospiraceae bacterium]|nr:PilZ domain-containing protein [Oscillospiraceae bacterium]